MKVKKYLVLFLLLLLLFSFVNSKGSTTDTRAEDHNRETIGGKGKTDTTEKPEVKEIVSPLENACKKYKQAVAKFIELKKKTDPSFKGDNIDYIGKDSTFISDLEKLDFEGKDQLVSELNTAKQYMENKYGYLLESEEDGGFNVKSCDDQFVKDNIAQEKTEAKIQQEIANYKFEKVQPTKEEIQEIQGYIEHVIQYSRCKQPNFICTEEVLNSAKSKIIFENGADVYSVYTASGNVADIIVDQDTGKLTCRGQQQPCYVDKLTGVVYDVETSVKVENGIEKIVFSYNDVYENGVINIEGINNENREKTIATAILDGTTLGEDKISVKDSIVYEQSKIQVNLSGVKVIPELDVFAGSVSIDVDYEFSDPPGMLTYNPLDTKYIAKIKSNLVQVVEGPVLVTTSLSSTPIQVDTGEELYFDQATEKFEKRLLNIDKAAAEFDQSMEEAKQIVQESRSTTTSASSPGQRGQCAIGLISLLVLGGALVFIRK